MTTDSLSVSDVLVVGTGVLTAFATLYALWQRRKYAPQPAWETIVRGRPSIPDGHGNGIVPSLEVEFLNVGDGAAYGVSASTHGRPTAHPSWGDFPLGQVEPGGRFSLHVGMLPVSGDAYLEASTAMYVDTRAFHPSRFQVEVRWRQPPRRNRVRRHRAWVEVPAGQPARTASGVA